jgi:uncharacterized protein YdeI (YjbR/CyaY-like superfamily)
MKKGDFEILAFETAKEFRQWLSKNYSNSSGIYIRFYKKASGVKSINYAEALDEALCFGWIDSIANTLDAQSYIQKFTPRRAKSMWSKRNREYVARLVSEGRMTEAGVVEVEKAKTDGRWDQAYDSPKDMTVPEEFLQLLEKNKKAKAFFETLNKTNRYAIGWRLQTAKKAETRERRMKMIVEMLERGEKLH